MDRRNKVPESVSMETPKAKKAESRRRSEIEARRRIEDLPSMSASSAGTWAVSPSEACFPHRISDASGTYFSMNALSVLHVA